jgi:glycogen debranching enzyme
VCCVNAIAQNNEQGGFFYKKTYTKEVVPTFASVSDKLPEPIMNEKPLWVEVYWKAWELAFKQLYEPTEANGFVSPYFDAAFNRCVFLWDMSFITFFTNYGYPWIHGIASLDNFYAKQHPTGEICREIFRSDGTDSYWANLSDEPLYTRLGYIIDFEGFTDKNRMSVTYVGREIPVPNPRLTLDGLNHPILAWAEWESFKLTGDRERLQQVYLPLVKYYEALQKYIRQGNGLYMTDRNSMDNSLRNPWLRGGGTGIDISSEMALFARNLADMAGVLGNTERQNHYIKEAEVLSAVINEKMWNDESQFYFDLNLDEELCDIKTVAGFWPLIAQVASSVQAKHLAAHLQNPRTFGRLYPVPSLSADVEGYISHGGYWRGAVWPPTNTMVVLGLEKYGYDSLAYTIAMKHIEQIAGVYRHTGTIWENYAADFQSQGFFENGQPVKKNFVGWSGIGPIRFLLEYGIGLKADAVGNKIVWTLHSPDDVGCNRFSFNSACIHLLAKKTQNGIREIHIESDKDFLLEVKYHGAKYSFPVRTGKQTFSVPD